MKKGKVAGGTSELTSEIIQALPHLIMNELARFVQARLQDLSEEAPQEPTSWKHGL